jgi:hypothetical protein
MCCIERASFGRDKIENKKTRDIRRKSKLSKAFIVINENILDTSAGL